MNILNDLQQQAKGIFSALQIVVLLFLVACSGNHHQDLTSYINSVKARKQGRIKGLPEIRPYESFTYDPSNLRDPFSPLIREKKKISVMGSGLRPDSNRKREALEQFSLDSLVFAGTLERNGKLWGLIAAPDNTVYRVQPGNHLGQNFGEILSISETTILVKEIIPNGTGGWIDRKVSLQLTE